MLTLRDLRHEILHEKWGGDLEKWWPEDWSALQQAEHAESFVFHIGSTVASATDWQATGRTVCK